MPSEGKSFVAANLAMSLARNSVNNILLIDGDLRRPTLHKLLGTPNEPGLTEFLAGTAELNAILQRDLTPETERDAGQRGISNLTLIPAGRCGDNSSELVANRRIDELIVNLSPHFDWILIDSPPVLAVTDGVELARAADAVLLVVRGATTPYDVAQRTQANFTNSRILGFVLNDVQARSAPRILTTTITEGRTKIVDFSGERTKGDKNDTTLQRLLSNPHALPAALRNLAGERILSSGHNLADRAG